MNPSSGTAVAAPAGPRVDLAALAAYFAAQPDVTLAYLFGSLATGRANRLSDVDLAVLLDPLPEGEALIERRLALMAGAEAAAEGEVQVVALNQAPPLLAHEVIRYGRLLFRRSQAAQVAFEVRTRKLYFDTKPMLEFHQQAVMNAIQEVGPGNRGRRAATSRPAG